MSTPDGIYKHASGERAIIRGTWDRPTHILIQQFGTHGAWRPESAVQSRKCDS